MIVLIVAAAGCSSSTDADDSTETTTTPQAPATTEAAPVTTTTKAAATTTQAPATTTSEARHMELTSPAFDHESPIPTKHACDGEDLSPSLVVGGIPSDAVALVLIMDDPDAPVGTWDHWIAYDIDPTDLIAEGDHTIGTSGLNSWGETGYGGPCPPSGTHRYFFKLYALDSALDLAEGSDKAAVEAAMDGNIVAEAELMGTYTLG